MAELAEKLDQLGRDWAEFKDANDAAIAEKIKKGTEDFVTVDKVEKINKSITDTLDAIKALESAAEKDRKAREALEVAIQRGDYGAGNDNEREEKVAYLNQRIKSLNKAAGTVKSLDQYKSGLEKYLRKDEHLHSLSDDERKALTVGKDPDGGFVVTPSTDADIVRFVHESSNMRQAAMIKTISSDAYEGSRRLGTPAAGWVGETQPRTETKAHDYSTYRVPAHELYAWPEISQKLLEDADVDVEAELRDEVGAEFSRKEETAFFVGTGVNQPRGFLTHPAGTPTATAFNVIQRFSTGVNGGFASSNPGDIFHTVIGSVKQPLLPGARFMMSRTTLAAARKLKDGDGTYLCRGHAGHHDRQQFHCFR